MIFYSLTGTTADSKTKLRSRISRELRQEPIIRKCISDLEERFSQRRKKLDRKIEATLNELLHR